MLSLGLVVAVGIVLAAGGVSGFAGFGFSLVSVPLLLQIFDPATVVTLSTALGLATNWIIVLDSWREVRVRTVLALLPWACGGLVVGVEMLKLLDPVYLKLLAGLVVIGLAVLLLCGRALPGARTPWATALVGATSGALNTSTGLSGPPIVLLFTARDFGKGDFRASASAYFFPINVIGLVLLVARGVVHGPQLGATALLVPPALIGTLAGHTLLKRVSNASFRTLTLYLILLTGLVGAATALLSLAARYHY